MRWILGGPAALIAAVLIMAAMPVWLPAGAGGVDNIIYPIILAPLIWAVVFMYSVLEENLPRGLAVAAGVILVLGGMVVLSVTDRTSVVSGKSVSVRVDLGGRRFIQP